MNFEINLIFLINLLFLHDQKNKTKIWIPSERKELLRWNKKHFLSILQGVTLKLIKQIFLEELDFKKFSQIVYSELEYY